MIRLVYIVAVWLIGARAFFVAAEKAVFQGFDFIKGSTFFHETSLKFHEVSTISFHMLW